MSSARVHDRIRTVEPHFGAPVREFLSALAVRRTYSPARNPYVAIGFLWGLPVPFFALGLHAWVTGSAPAPGLIAQHPIHVFFLLHPLLFAVVFGAMGTIRQRKDRQIARLVLTLERRARQLTDTATELQGANDRLRELDHLKAQFMANVTHELKTPLVAIRGYNESILEGRFGPLTDKQREGLAVAVRNVDRLQKLIEELLEFERIDSGSLKLNLTDFDLGSLVLGTLESFRPQIEARKLSVQLRLPEPLPVHADRDKIGHVLLNLLSNAVKFSPDGKALGVDARVGEEDGQVWVSVWDRGPGIATDAQKYLFTRFWQADGSSRRRYGGTGLGLAIVKGILDAHGSTIRIVSKEGNGTSAEFTLPLGEAVPSGNKEEAYAG